MIGELIKKEDNHPQIESEKITEDNRDTLSKFVSASYNGMKMPEGLVNKINREILPKFVDWKNMGIKQQSEVVIKMIRQLGLDTQVPLFNSVGNGGMVMDVAKQIIEEYDCKTASEKATAQIAANAFVRIMENSEVIRASRNSSINLKLVPYFSIISKELDRATRQYEAAVSNLIRMKTPPINVKVTTKTAFMAGNQQFNVNQENNGLK